MATSAMTLTSTRQEATSPTVWRGLLLREWWAHRPLLVIVGYIYAISPWIAILAAFAQFSLVGSIGGGNGEVLFSSVAWAVVPWYWTFWGGVALAITFGLALGGAETTAGLEEGSLSLPATRHQRFWARFAFAGGILAAHSMLNTIALVLWHVAVVRPRFAVAPWSDWIIIAFITPLVVFSLAWTAAVNGGPRRRIVLVVCGIGLLFLTQYLGSLVWTFRVSGFLQMLGDFEDPSLMILILPTWAIWMLHLAYRIYCTREIHALQDN